jgi:NAD(P)-dependent dehydrogenase (short-subunit alcohol dehydrogenase family)
MSVYGATKSGIRNMVRTWIQEIKGSGIRINLVSPRPIMTPGLEDFLSPKSRTFLESRSTVG